MSVCFSIVVGAEKSDERKCVVLNNLGICLSGSVQSHQRILEGEGLEMHEIGGRDTPLEAVAAS